MRQLDSMHKVALAVCLATSVLVVIAGVVWGIRLINANRSQASTQQTSLATGGFPLSGDIAPDFTLTDQFGQTQTLSSLRGREVALAFIDSRSRRSAR